MANLWYTLKFDPLQPDLCAWCGSANITRYTGRKRGTYYCGPDCTRKFYAMIQTLRFFTERKTER